MGQSDSLSRWYWRNPLPAGNTLNAVAYGNGTFIAVGDGAMVLVSTDGTHWAMRDFGIQCQLSGVAYGGGLFVVMGNSDGIPVVGTSTDGIDWESATLDTPLLPEAVVYGNGRFVAVASRASNAGSLVSTNGLDWIPQPIEDAHSLNAIAYARGLFVAVGRDYQFVSETQEARILTSQDGLHWTQQQVPVSPSTYEPELKGVTYGNGQFVAVGEPDASFPNGPLIVTSPDGTNWSREQFFLDYLTLSSVGYGNGRFVAVGSHRDWDADQRVGDLLISADGTDWQPQHPTAMRGVEYAVAWGAGVFLAVGAYGEIISSADSIDWGNQTHGFYGGEWDLNGVAASTNVIVAVGGNRHESRGGILASTNGMEWMCSTSGVYSTFQDVMCVQGRFVAVGSTQPHNVGGRIRISDDGLTWAELPAAPYPLYAIAYGNGFFVAVGGQCNPDSDVSTYTATSLDGQAWTSTYGTNGRLRAVAFGNGVFVAVGDPDDGCGGTAMTSADGARWTPLDYQTFSALTPNGSITYAWPAAVAFGNGRFVGASSSGDIWTSINGDMWVYHTNLPSADIKKITYANRSFFALGSPVATSPDGIQWTAHLLDFNALTYVNGTYIGCGNAGAILQSDSFPPADTTFALTLNFTTFPELLLTGGSNRAFRIEFRDELRAVSTWQFLTNLYPTTSPFSWKDTRSAPFQRRFYRSVLLP